MKKLSLIIVLISTTMFITSCSNSTSQEVVKNAVFLNANELKEEYGDYVVFSENQALWKLENGIKLMVWYSDSAMEKPDLIQLQNVDYSIPELFYDDLGWDLPYMDVDGSSKKIKVTKLYGMNEAIYHTPIKTLRIELNNPVISTFGKRIK